MNELSQQYPMLIQLTQGQWAVVDEIDADLGDFKWCAAFRRSYGNGGAFEAQRHSDRVNGKRHTIALHRAILARTIGRELTRTEQVDHKDLNPLNNRRGNLRLATHAQNQHNRRRSCNNTSGYKGVTFYAQYRRWRAQISVDGKRKHLGYFDAAEQAHAAYRAAASVLYGDFARFE